MKESGDGSVLAAFLKIFPYESASFSAMLRSLADYPNGLDLWAVLGPFYPVAWRLYREAETAAMAKYDRDTASATARYCQIVQEFWDKHDPARTLGQPGCTIPEEVFIACRLICSPAWVECEQILAPAKAECNQACRAALRRLATEMEESM